MHLSVIHSVSLGHAVLNQVLAQTRLALAVSLTSPLSVNGCHFESWLWRPEAYTHAHSLLNVQWRPVIGFMVLSKEN